MKYVVYTVGTMICLNTSKRVNETDKPKGFKMELETDELTEALQKFNQLQIDKPENTAENLLSDNEDWDSKEMVAAREEANRDKGNDESKDSKAKE